MQDNADKKAQKRDQVERDHNDRYYNPRRKPSDVEKDGLEGMEADGPVLVVRRQHQKQNACDETKQVAECTGHVVVH